MITVVRIDNPFEPFRRETSEVEFEKGMTTADICREASVDDLVAGAIGHNGSFLGEDESRTLEDGDFVTIVVSPGGPAWEKLFVLILKAFVVGVIAKSLMPKIDEPESPDSAYSYYGFRNAYLPEGSAVPLVYGTMRAAPPCINQSILGGSPTTFGVNDLTIARTETLNTLLAISEGPIYGLGDFTGVVQNEAEQNTLVGGGPVGDGIGMLVNGIVSTALEGQYAWRTGDQYQEAFHGESGFLDPSDLSTIYQMSLQITLGTEGIDGTSGEFPAGIVTYANRIIDTDSTQFVSQQLSELASLANVQFMFPKGLYTDADDGTPNNETVKMRVQYWETDSGGTAVGDVILLPPVNITNNLLTSFSADYKFPLWTASSVTTGTQGGFLSTNTQNWSSRRTWLRLTDATGLGVVNPGDGDFYACSWVRSPDQTSTDYTSPYGCVFSWSDDDSDNRDFQRYKNMGGSTLRIWAPNGATLTSYQGWAFTWTRIYEDDDGDPGDFLGYGLVFWAWHGGSYTRWYSPSLREDAPNDTGWMHLGFHYNHSEDAVTVYYNGDAYTTVRQSSATTPNKPRFPSTGSVFSIGNYLNSYASDDDDTRDSSTKLRIQGVALLSGAPSATFFQTAAWQVDRWSGNHTWLPSTLEGDPTAKLLYDFFTPIGSPSAGAANEYYRNYALAATDTTEAQGIHHVYVSSTALDGTVAAPNTGSHLWNVTTGSPSKSYWKIEVFKDKGDGEGAYDEPNRQNSVTVDAITTFSTQEFAYPGTALLSASLVANEEVNNSQPELTVLVHGIMVPVWVKDGSLADNPTIERQFSRNPAWIALDLLTNTRYAMGEIFSPEGTYELIDLQSFRQWANFCDEGVADGFGVVQVFGIEVDDHLIPELVLYIGLTKDAGAGVMNLIQSIPETWRVGWFVSLTSCSGGLPDFTTSNDVEGGQGDASNRLKILEIEPESSSGGYHGWNGYAKVTLEWNRTKANGNPDFPEGVGGDDEWYADEITESSTTLTEAMDATESALDVDDIAVFSGLYWGPGHSLHYAQITSSGGSTETVLVTGINSYVTSTIDVYRAQQGTTAITASSGDTIALLAGDAIATVSGYEIRCQFDGIFDQNRTAGWDALLEVFQCGRAMPVKAGSKITAVVSQPTDPVALFTQGNIVSGSFSVSYLSAKDKPNSLTVKYLDSDHNYEGRSVILDHPSTYNAGGSCTISELDNETDCVNAGGEWTGDENAGWSNAEFATRRSETMDARGVTRRSQATRDATYRLNRYNLQRRGASFEVGPDAIHLLPGDRILVSHDTPQYGYSGRIPEDGTWNNSYPSGGLNSTDTPNLYEAFTLPGDNLSTALYQGGGVYRGTWSLATTIQPAAITPPLAAYSSPVTMFRSSAMNGDGTMPAGLAASGSPLAGFDGDKGDTGGTTTWASQFMYPSSSDIKNNGVDIDVIESTTHKSCFSAYFKEPAKGAARGIYLNIYRIYDKDLNYSTGGYYAKFRWESGALVTVGSPIAGVTQAVESIGSGWYRASCAVDWSAISDITPAAAVGYHLQARIYSYDYQDNGAGGWDGVNSTYGLWKGVTSIAADGNSVTWNDDGTVRRGRGNNFLAYGDPFAPTGVVWDGDADGTATVAWTKVNMENLDNDTSNQIYNIGTAPPFYPEATGAGDEEGGKYGYVVGFYAGKTGAANYLSSSQVINLNATTSSALAGGANWAYHFQRFNGRDDYGVFSNEPMILSFYFKKGRNGNVETKFEARLMFNNSVDGNGHADELFAAVEITIPASSGDPTFAYTLDQTGSTSSPDLDWAEYSYGGDATYAAKVRQNSTTTDDDWYYVRIAVVCAQDFRTVANNYTGHLGVQFIMGATGGSNATTTGLADIWGVRLSGLAGDSKTEGGCSTTVRYYNLDVTNRHRGILVWGPMYENGVDEPSDFTIGSSLKLDRDVSVEAGKEYEVYVRNSGALADSVNPTDLQEVLSVSSSEIPASGTTVIPARTLIETSLPTKFLPGTGDVYSFGEAGKTTEDFTIATISTDPNTLIRTIECVEYHEGIFNDDRWGTLGDPTISAIGANDGSGEEEYAMGGGGSFPENISLRAFASGYRGPSGEPIAGVWLRWGSSSRNLPFSKVNIYLTQLDATPQDDGSYRETPPELIATCSATQKEYRYDGPALVPGRLYRFRLQPVGKKGTSRALRRCPQVTISPVVNPPTPVAPTLTATLHGKKQMYKVAQTGTARDYAIEGRIGGWIVSTPAWIIDPNTDRFVSEGLLPVPTNDAGSTQASIYARPKLLNGSYGNATTVTGTEAMVDVRASRQVIAENDYAAVQSSVTGELQIVTGTTDSMRWNTSSTSVAEQTWKMTEIDATTPRRTVVNAIIEGFQERPETFDDFGDHTLGSQVGRNWSIEGPMKDDGYNGTVELQWRWTSGSSITGEDFRPFEPGEIYARKVQFQLLFNRAAITLKDPTEGSTGTVTGYANTTVTRFTIIENDLPSEHFVDGGTF